MSDVLDEAQSLVQCRTCPWYKTCILPIRFTEDDLRRQLESSLLGSTMQGITNDNIRQLISGMASAVQNTLLEGCPVFIYRLRSNPKLAEKLKKIMQEWSNISQE